MDESADRHGGTVDICQNDVDVPRIGKETELRIDPGRASIVAVVTVAGLAMIPKSVSVTAVRGHSYLTSE